MSDPINERLDRLVAIQEELETILQTLVLNDSTIIDALAQMLGAIQQMHTRAQEALIRCQAANSQSSIIIQNDGSSALNPEIGLLEHLYSFLEIPCAIDVGANVGDVSARLLQTGCTVYAFEPYQPVFAELLKLQSSAADGGRFYAFNCAIGATDGNMRLHIAANTAGGRYDTSLFHSLVEHPMLDDCKFTQSVPVEVRTLDSLCRSGDIPERVGLLKIDTEGFDLEVIRGMGRLRAPIVMAEFWHAEHPFGRAGHGRLHLMVKEMRERHYRWHLVIYHLDEESIVAFSTNRTDSPPKAWGNAIFFREHAPFAAALSWCQTMLPATLYR